MDLQIDAGRTEYIARISHGKDSLKMLDVIVSRGLPLDRITTTDVWATDTIRGEHPKMVEFKDRADEYIWRKYHIEVEHLCAMRDGKKVTYEQMFYQKPKRRRGLLVEVAHSKAFLYDRSKKVEIRGFPISINNQGSWCQRLKTDVLDSKKTGEVREYIGIAADEPKRFGQLNDRRRAPLVEFGIEEDLCGIHCQYEGILGPAYETGCRDGCWMCHNQGTNQLRLLRHDYPDLWALLLKWDADSPVNFHPDGHTVHDYDLRFRLEDEGLLIPGDPCFRWKQLDEDLQYNLL